MHRPCRYLGIEENEIETLADEKEGCDDEIETITVQRPLSFKHIVSNSDSDAEDADVIPNGVIPDDATPPYVVAAGGNGAGPKPTPPGMKWVKLPLGSARVSLGYMSTFRDVEKFVQFVEKKYKDRSG